MKKLFALLAVFMAVCAPAWASSHSGIYTRLADETGISIPPLVHGQMQILANNRSDIQALADKVAPHDPTVLKLQAYITAQRRAAWYGIMPMAIAEAESPFHLPTHGYLAASRVLLLHLNTLAAGNEEVSALTDKVEMQMLANSVSLSVCVYSATPFNSASLVQPQWQLTFQHLPTLATLMLPFLLIIALLLHIVPRSRRAPVPLPA